MSRRVLAVLVCTFLALVAATVWVPVGFGYRDRLPNAVVEGKVDAAYVESRFGPWTRDEGDPMVDEFKWAFDLWVQDHRDPVKARSAFLARERIVWPIVFAEQALILLLGGVLLTWAIRRERRRRAAA